MSLSHKCHYSISDCVVLRLFQYQFESTCIVPKPSVLTGCSLMARFYLNLHLIYLPVMISKDQQKTKSETAYMVTVTVKPSSLYVSVSGGVETRRVIMHQLKCSGAALHMLTEK